MDIDERKKVVKGISITAVLGVIATVVGILANIHELGWFEKDEPDLPSSSVADMQENPDDYSQPVIADENSEEETIPPAPTYSYTRLCDLEPADSAFYHKSNGKEKDTVGNIYGENAIRLSAGFDDTGFATYYLGGKYKILTGTIAISNESDSLTTIFNISGDDNILYTTGEIDKVFAPVEISLDVEGIQWLRLDNLSQCNIAGADVEVILANGKLE